MARSSQTPIRLLTTVALLAAGFAVPVAVASASAGDAQDESRREVLSKRTETSQTFQNPDGSLTSEISSQAMRFKDAAGKWTDIDTTLVRRNGHYEPRATKVDMTFSDGGDTQFVDFAREGGDSIALGWPDRLPQPQVDANVLTYPDVVPNGDLVVTALPTGFSHSIVLREAPADPELTIPLPVDLNGTTLKETSGGGLFVSSADDTAVRAPAPLMWDSSVGAFGLPDNTEPVDAAVTKTGNTTTLTLTPDAGMLSDPDTKYPVTIDPTFTQDTPTSDTFITSAGSYTSSNTVKASDIMVTGYSTDWGGMEAYSFLKFPNFDYNNKVIDSAELQVRNVKSNVCTNASTVAERVTGNWSQNTLTWDNKPGADTTSPPQYYLAHGGPSGSACAAHGWGKWNVGSAVKKWAAGSPNYGLRLRAATAGWTNAYKQWRAQEGATAGTGTTYYPKLVINYTEKAPVGGAFVALPSPTIYDSAQGTSLGAGQTQSFSTRDNSGIPANGVSALLLNVTAQSTTATSGGALTVWPANETRPTSPTLLVTGATAPRSNTSIVPVGTTGSLSIFNAQGTSSARVEVLGYFTAENVGASSGYYVPIEPNRLVDTNGEYNGDEVPQQKLAPGATLEVHAGGVGRVSANSSAVFANVEVSDGNAAGALNVKALGSTGAGASISYAAGAPTNSAMTVPLSSGGRFVITNQSSSGSVNVAVDVQGYFAGSSPGSGGFTPLPSATIYSTDTAGQSVLGPNQTRVVPLNGKASVPADNVGAVAATLVVKNWSAPGAVTVWNSDHPRDETSNLSFDQSQSASNGVNTTVLPQPSLTGTISIHNSSAAPVSVSLSVQGAFGGQSFNTRRQLSAAMDRAFNAKATQADLTMLETYGYGEFIADQGPPTVEITEENDGVEFGTEDDTAGTGGTEPVETCDPATSNQCFSGVTSEGEDTSTTPTSARTSSLKADVPSCSSGQTAKRYTAHVTKKSKVGTVVYKWAQRIHYCIAGGKVVKWRLRRDFSGSRAPGVREGALRENFASALPISRATSYRKREMIQCLPTLECTYNYPHITMKVGGNGSKSYTGGAS